MGQQIGERQAGATAPAHTLTFLFADVRGYTQFVETRGDAAAAALLSGYRRLVRDWVARTGGAEIKTEGDSFYIVFDTAHQALDCAIGIVRDAERHSRELPELPLRIGVGIHAGEPVPQEGQYVGSAVNVAARLAQSAGAGELLVSEVVRGLLRTSGAPPMRERRGLVLKGIDDPPRIFAVRWHEAPEAATAAVLSRPVLVAAAAIVVALAVAVAVVVVPLARRQPEASSRPAEASAAVVPKGALLWAAALDGTDREFEAPSVTGDAAASALRARQGELELSVLRSGGGIAVRFREKIPAAFVAEVDLRASSSSDVRFLWSVHSAERAEHQVRIDTAPEELWISYVNTGITPSKADRLSPRVRIPRLLSGRAVRVALVSDARGYRLYLDDREVAGVVDSRLAEVSSPFTFGVQGRDGSITLTGVRAYVLGR